jgi:hypothetical protein
MILGLLLVACSTPPDTERQQAEVALQAARDAGAPAYAPAEFENAQAAFRKSDAAVAQRDYRQALSHALDARDLAYAAVKRVDARKTELQSQADRLATELDSLLAAGGRATGAAAARLRTARDAGRTALQEARTNLAQLDYQNAVRTLEPAVSRLRREMPGQDAPAQKRKK